MLFLKKNCVKRIILFNYDYKIVENEFKKIMYLH